MKINLQCDTCHTIHSVNRTEEIPENVTSLTCNWCPLCEDEAEDYYSEEWVFCLIDPIPDPINPDQIKLFEDEEDKRG